MNATDIRSPYGLLGPLDVPLALGLLRLSTEGRPDEGAAIAVIHAALDRGIRILDTADSYALSDTDMHYGERLARAALDSWNGPRHEVKLLTKVGFVRPKGRWVPNGRPDHIRKSVEQSLRALGVERIPILQLHAADPRTPFEDTLGALAELRREGKVEHIGLCNVSVAEVHQAQRHFPVVAIQNELSVVDRGSATDGLVALARAMGIAFLAHRPMGGHAKAASLAKNRVLKPLASKLLVTPHQAALAALLDLGAPVIPLFGATRIESVEASVAALRTRLDDNARAEITSRISFEPTAEALATLAPHVVPNGLRELRAGEGPGEEPEVVVVMGIQGAGKSARVAAYEARGYERLNRDTLGGTLDELVPRLTALLSSGKRRIVLDNTYPTRISRAPVIRASHAHGIPVRCIYLATSMRDATVNVVQRILERHGRLLGPDDLKALAKTDPNLPPPAALDRFAAQFERPSLDEGFGVVEEIPFVRRTPTPRTTKGLFLDVDGTLRKTKSGEIYPRTVDDIEILPRRRDVLRRWIDQGYRLFFVSNQSGVASGQVSHDDVAAIFARTIELLDLPVADVAFCPHPSFPVGCFCRKPMPGMGVHLIEKHGLDSSSLVMVGDMDSDERFAEAIGAKYHHADSFFGS
jgi:HAD superfamily hydrolase (TIGR01662 family)